MILPATLPATPALSPTAQVPAETPETSGEFAALLGLMLEAGTAEHAAVPSAATTPIPIAPPATGNPGGNSLPDELPSPATASTEASELDVLSAIITPSPVAALTPFLQVAPPAEGTAETPVTAPRHAVGVRQIPAQFAEGNTADNPTPAQPQQQRTEQKPPAAAAALPRLVLPNADETASPVSSTSVRMTPASLEGATPSTPTAPQLTFAVAEAPVTSPAATAPNSVRPQAPHDFATLVDRLVEARDTARAVQAPQTVSASLAHAQFGDIAIRFEHGGNALSVALSNRDPEFARAVQAAAPATHANDSGAASARQDATGQQAGNASGQSSQSLAQQRGTGSLARGAAPQGHGQDEQQPGRSGIFA